MGDFLDYPVLFCNGVNMEIGPHYRYSFRPKRYRIIGNIAEREHPNGKSTNPIDFQDFPQFSAEIVKFINY
jgi:hypothetical protein